MAGQWTSLGSLQVTLTDAQDLLKNTSLRVTRAPSALRVGSHLARSTSTGSKKSVRFNLPEDAVKRVTPDTLAFSPDTSRRAGGPTPPRPQADADADVKTQSPGGQDLRASGAHSGRHKRSRSRYRRRFAGLSLARSVQGVHSQAAYEVCAPRALPPPCPLRVLCLNSCAQRQIIFSEKVEFCMCLVLKNALSLLSLTTRRYYKADIEG